MPPEVVERANDPCGPVETSPRTAPIAIALGQGRALSVQPCEGGALLRVASASPAERLDVEIRFEASGPVVRARATALELDSPGNVTARCERFRIDARSDIELCAQGKLNVVAAEQLSMQAKRVLAEATHGRIQLQANDDVQLLGELILLNCDRVPPVPPWALPSARARHELAPAAETGDREVVEFLKKS